MVTVPTFQIMMTEVTVAMYQACVDTEQCTDDFDGDGDDHPAILNWYQLNEFAAWVGGRLPTEAEWEYAARSRGKNITYPWGNREATCRYAVMDDGGNGCGKGQTWPVCSKTSGNTEQGLCDMAGNVWEWVQDEYHSSYEGAPSDGSGWCAGDCPVNASDPNYNASDSAHRVLRGGWWPYAYATPLRAANRHHYDPSGRDISDRGGRVLRSVPLNP